MVGLHPRSLIRWESPRGPLTRHVLPSGYVRYALADVLAMVQSTTPII